MDKYVIFGEDQIRDLENYFRSLSKEQLGRLKFHFRSSIRKWWYIWRKEAYYDKRKRGDGSIYSLSMCGLCRFEFDCQKCPVYHTTKCIECVGTPFESFYLEMCYHQSKRKKLLRLIARDELSFIIALYREYKDYCNSVNVIRGFQGDKQ